MNPFLDKWHHSELTQADILEYVNRTATEQDNLDDEERKQVAERLFSIYLWDTHGAAIDDLLVSLLKDRFSEFMTNARYIDRKACRIYHEFIWRTSPASVLTKAKHLR